MFPHDDLHPSLHKRVMEELANSSTGQIEIFEQSETIAELNSKANNFNRLVLQSGTPYNLMSNVQLPHGHCSPVIDPAWIQQLAADLESHL